MSKRKQNNKNALKHGAFATETILQGESVAEYEKLRAAVYEEWRPEGVTEEFEADKLVKLMWRRRRLERYEQINTDEHIDLMRRQTIMSHHWENLKSLSPQFGSAATAEDVEAILSELSEMYANAIRSNWPLVEGTDPAEWGKKIEKGLKAVELGPRWEGPTAFVEAFRPEDIDIELERLERIDALIERTIKRLVQLKAMKQMLPAPPKDVSRKGAKLIDLSVSQKSEGGAQQPTGDVATSAAQSMPEPQPSGHESTS